MPGSIDFVSLIRQGLTEKWSDGPQTNDELHEYISETFGFNIPRKAVCRGHQGPFDFVADAYFERVSSALVLACRTGGKTLNIAALNVLDAGFKGTSVANVAGSKLQAKRCYDYSKGFWERDPILEAKLEKEPLMSETRLKGGVTYEILAGSTKSVRSPHVPRLRMDEIEEMDDAVFNGALSIPTSQGGVPAQVVMASTRHKAHGKMQKMLDEAEEKGFRVYQWCVWETMQACEHDCRACPMRRDCVGCGEDDPPCNKCPLEETCEGRARNADGYRTYEDVLQQFMLHDRDTWESEHLCSRPSKHLLVYPAFDQAVHLVDDVPPGLDPWGCVDWGFENPFVFLSVGVAGNEKKYVLEENYRRHMTDAELASEMWEKYGGKIRNVACDPSNPGGIKEFKKVGFRVLARASKVKDGISEIRKDLKPNTGSPRLYFVRGKTRELTAEMESYQNRPGSDEPKKEDDHGPDAIRYLYAVNVKGRKAMASTAKRSQ